MRAGRPDTPVRRRAQGPGLVFTVKGEEIINLTGDATPTRPTMYPWMGIELPSALGASLPADIPGFRPEPPCRARNGLSPSLPDRQAGCGDQLYGGCACTPRSLGEGPLITKNTNELKGVDKGKLMMGTTQDTPLVKFDLVLSANLQVNGKMETIVAPAITVDFRSRLYSRAQIPARYVEKWRKG